MCQFASFILTKYKALWLTDSDNHEDIIHYYKSQHLDIDPIGLVRVEIIPPKISADKLDSWKFQVDQDVYPDWTCQGDPSLEIRTREALRKRSVEEKWFETAMGQHVIVSNYGTAIAGDHGTASAGRFGRASAGYKGIATAGDHGTAFAGKLGKVIAGDFGKASAGDLGTAIAGSEGKASVGNRGTATAGDFGTAIAGSEGKASVGDYGNATAGDDGTASAGDDGTASAGEGGVIVVHWIDSAKKRKILVGYIGDEGLEPHIKYRVEDGVWVKVN